MVLGKDKAGADKGMHVSHGGKVDRMHHSQRQGRDRSGLHGEHASHHALVQHTGHDRSIEH